MTAPLDDQYFEWLYGIIWPVTNRNPQRSYWHLARQLYSTEFVWMVPNDDNRVEDGKELRLKWSIHKHVKVDRDWLDLGCSMFEMMIALAGRAAFESGDTPAEWMWTMMTNLRLEGFTDQYYNSASAVEVADIIERVIYRTYREDGWGGLFPLKHAERDQRKVELWYQLSAYLIENTTL